MAGAALLQMPGEMAEVAAAQAELR